MGTWLFDNPILIKHVRSRLRRQHVVPLLVSLPIVAGCIMWFGMETDGLTNGVLFSLLLVLQGAVLLLSGTMQVAMAVSKANESGILDFHRASPLPAVHQTIGFVLGAPIREYLIVACLMPFSLLCAILGSPGLGGFVVVYAILLLSVLVFHTLGAVAGLITNKRRGSNGGVVLFVMIAHFCAGAVYQGFALPGLLTCPRTAS